MEIFQDGKKVFTLIWRIKNVSFGWIDRTYAIQSPTFKLQTKKISSWRIGIDPVGAGDWIDHCLWTMHSVSSSIGLEIACLDKNGSSLISTQVPRVDFSTKLQYEGAFRKSEYFLTQDTLTIRLKMWEVEDSSLVTEQVFAETELEVKRGSSFWFVKNFSNLKCGEMKALMPRNSSTDSMSISFNICQEKGDYIKIKVAKLGSKPAKHCKCNFFLLDAAGEKVECGKLDIMTAGKQIEPEWGFPLTMKKIDLLNEKTRFLPYDVLSFQCDFAFSTGHTSEEIFNSKVAESFNFLEKNSEKLNTLQTDLKSLYNEPILFDTKLQTATESFFAHSAILSARSPVFRAMFTTEMKEKSKECVYIEDLQASTVRRMLLFLYSDILEDMDWESAKNLYIASDKYDIVYLRHLCSSFLIKNLLPSNCCDVLLLAHMHQDSKFVSSVQDFMLEHTKEILTSEEWKILEKKDTLLTSKTLRLLLLKNLPK